MGVYIKGMEMPTSCRRCDFSQPDGCGFFCPIVVGKPIVDSLTHSRHARCTLVPIPPHGDLVERNALLRVIPGEEMVSRFAVSKAPIIIPAEGG